MLQFHASENKVHQIRVCVNSGEYDIDDKDGNGWTVSLPSSFLDCKLRCCDRKRARARIIRFWLDYRQCVSSRERMLPFASKNMANLIQLCVTSWKQGQNHEERDGRKISPLSPVVTFCSHTCWGRKRTLKLGCSSLFRCASTILWSGMIFT